MVILLKEALVYGEWQFLGPVYIKKDSKLWPVLSKYGKQYEKGPTSHPVKMHLKFHSPDKVRQFNSDSILQVRDHFAGFDKLVGYWPWDSPDVLRFPADMDQLFSSYGFSDIRLTAWKE